MTPDQELKDAATRLRRDADAVALPLTGPFLQEVASWLEDEAQRWRVETLSDTGDCPSCGDGYCGPHPEITFRDDGCGGDLLWGGKPIHDDATLADRCRCFDRALSVARAYMGDA